jgi:hypothetical protein
MEPMNSVVTLRAEPHIRRDNKLWTVHGIWIFTQGTKGKSVETSIAFHLFLRKVIYQYTPSAPSYTPLYIEFQAAHLLLPSVNLVSHSTSLFLPRSFALWPVAPALE